MKLKTYFLTLLLFLLFFNGSIVLISYVNFSGNMNSMRERCLGEHYFIATSYAKDLRAVENRGILIKNGIESLFRSYVSYYGKENVFLEISKGKKPLYSNMPAEKIFSFKKYKMIKSNRILSTIKLNGKKYICIAGKLPSPYGRYTLTYLYNLSENIASCNRVTDILLLSGVILSFLLAICLILLLNYIFKPLHQISLASKKIAEGEYGNRIHVTGKDELSEMAQSFNNMAEEIQNQMLKLVKSADQKQSFIDNFAHELRTPLTTIYGYAEYIQKAAITEDEKLSATDYIMSESRRLQNMSCSLLELALMRNNEITFSEVNISQLLCSAVEALRLKAAAKHVSLEYDYQFDKLMGEYELLRCLIINLADNGIKACKQEGTVKLRALCDGSDKVIIVQDNGRGMNEDQIDHITEAFYRVDKARNRADGGAGLGLALCKQIAVCHGADLSFSSAVNKGTTAKVTFTTS